MRLGLARNTNCCAIFADRGGSAKPTNQPAALKGGDAPTQRKNASPWKIPNHSRCLQRIEPDHRLLYLIEDKVVIRPSVRIDVARYDAWGVGGRKSLSYMCGVQLPRFTLGWSRTFRNISI